MFFLCVLCTFWVFYGGYEDVFGVILGYFWGDFGGNPENSQNRSKSPKIDFFADAQGGFPGGPRGCGTGFWRASAVCWCLGGRGALRAKTDKIPISTRAVSQAVLPIKNPFPGRFE